MRIISGTSKGRKLVAPRNYSLRPTSDRVKESIFNILQDEIEGKVVLDLFAGTGNLGIEALSRGAKKTIFVEKGRQALRLIQRNLTQFGLEERSEILPKDANQAIGILKQRGEPLPPTMNGWNLIRQRRIGDTMISFLTPQGEDQTNEVKIES
jgi:16S rRNA (guanine(966)-N(2))-methyltransferase RsmD